MHHAMPNCVHMNDLAAVVFRGDKEAQRLFRRLRYILGINSFALRVLPDGQRQMRVRYADPLDLPACQYTVSGSGRGRGASIAYRQNFRLELPAFRTRMFINLPAGSELQRGDGDRTKGVFRSAAETDSRKPSRLFTTAGNVCWSDQAKSR